MMGHSIDFCPQKPVVMGILNITADSFFDGGRYFNEKEWLSRAEQIVGEGASVVDIGAMSTRPGSTGISEGDEIARIVPVVKRLAREFPEVCISVDTWRASVAEAAIEAGADMINDISGGTFDQKMFPVIRKYDVDYVLMHTKGTPLTMQQNPQYDDVTDEVRQFLFSRAASLADGFSGRILLDPGFGFGKTLGHNYELMRRLKEITSGEWPVLVGISRKSMIYKLLETDPEAALNGTSVLNLFSLIQGASVLRVHDVKEAVEVLKIFGQLTSGAK